MTETVFWDAWAFIAILDQTYRYHQVAKDVLAELDRQGAYALTTEAVLTEVGNTFSKRRSRHHTQSAFGLFRDYALVGRAAIVTVDHDLWQAGWGLYVDRPDKDWGHTDCISFITMQAFGILKAFTGDHHFEQAGFVRLVKP